jgi:hypothetical protein
METHAEVEIVWWETIQSVVIRPRRRGIIPDFDTRRIRFRLDSPGELTVEVNGYHHALHLFANPPESDLPNPNDPRVHFFGPGVHQAGKISLGSGETVYLAQGSVVYGAIEAREASHISILGRGILDGSLVPRRYASWEEIGSMEPYGAIVCYGCDDVRMGGIVVRDPNVYNITLAGCSGIQVANIKVVGSWRYNTDGIDLINSREAVIEDCFVRSFDDSVVVTGLPERRGFPCGHLNAQDILVRRCVVWNDWGRALEVGAACSAPAIRNIRFKDCDLIHVAHVALDVQNCGRAAVKDIRFEGIRVEADDGAPRPRHQTAAEDIYAPDPRDVYTPYLSVVEIKKSMWTRDKEIGQARDILFKNIQITATHPLPNRLAGYDACHCVENVVYQDIQVNGQCVYDRADGCVDIGPHVRQVTFL